MLVKPVNFINTPRITKYSKNRIYSKYNYVLPKDTVSFTGKNAISKSEIISTIDKTEPLSDDGFKGVVYKYDKDDKSYVIKVARNREFKFGNEAEILKQVPAGINCQRFVSYFQHPKTNCDILVSTFVDGKKRVLKTSDDFKQFFNLLLELDKSGVLHGDLNMQNCLFGQNGIGLIDFGEGEKFKIGDTYKDFIYPEFILKSNIVNLEHNGIPDCIQAWVKSGANSKECFKNYLIAKSEYYKLHANSLDSQELDLSQAIDFEKNYAEVLKNPSDLVVENEVRRIDCLYTFEHSDTAVNYRNIPSAAIRNWNLTVQKAKNQLDFINNVLNYANLSVDERKYFEYQEKIISLFFEQFSSWGSSTESWLNGLFERDNLSDFEKKFIINKEKTMALPPNLVNDVLG